MANDRRSGKPGIIEAAFLLGGYHTGYFPMADSGTGEIHWYSPDPRGIIPLESFKVSRSLAQTLRKKNFDVRFNVSFDGVIRACGERQDTWISKEIMESYLELHRLGFAHSVESWKDGELAGGLYGVALGAAFFGESMFSRKKDASKIALVHLVERLRSRRFELLDTQFVTPHLARFGAVEIGRRKYLALLQKAVRKKRSFAD